MSSPPPERHAAESRPRPDLYPRLLGPAWDELDAAVRRAHAAGSELRAAGTVRVRHGPSRPARLLLRLARVPPPAESVAVRLLVSRRGAVERWCRDFGGARLVSVQRATSDGLLAERFGGLELRFRLTAVDGALVYGQFALALRLGPLRLPLPRSLCPRVAAREAPAGRPDRTHLSVALTSPNGDLLFTYDGVIDWAEGAA